MMIDWYLFKHDALILDLREGNNYDIEKICNEYLFDYIIIDEFNENLLTEILDKMHHESKLLFFDKCSDSRNITRLKQKGFTEIKRYFLRGWNNTPRFVFAEGTDISFLISYNLMAANLGSFIEAGKCIESNSCKLDYAFITAYRHKGNRFATLVNSDKTVQKVSLDGIEYATELYKNTRALSYRGISVIPMQLEMNKLMMPRLDMKTLAEHWRYQLQMGTFNEMGFYRMFDKVYKAIIKSCSILPAGSYGWDEGLGVIAEKCYTELVPANAFYDLEKDEIIFFDQEFVLDNYPLSFVVTRAVNCVIYDLANNCDIDISYLHKNLIDKYGLAENYKILNDMVEEFNDWIFVRGE